MNILITGGAGYIGSHTVKELLNKGYKVVVYDNLSTGHKEFVPKQAVFIKGDLNNIKKLDSVFKKYKIDSVMHFAAFIEAGESVKYPLSFYENNVVNSLNLFKVMIKNNVKKIIFSSSAAVYGIPENIPVKEDDPKNPINPYGHTKLVVENILEYSDKAYGMKFIALRYFNAAGAALDSTIGEKHSLETHLIPIILNAALNKKPIKIFGTDYPTEDGTCIRDFIHVTDLANAHILALKALNKKNPKSNYYNLGSEKGYSVKEVIKICRKVTGCKIPEVKSNKRPGDPPVLIASSEKIKKELKWKPKYTNLNIIVESSWNWINKNHAE